MEISFEILYKNVLRLLGLFLLSEKKRIKRWERTLTVEPLTIGIVTHLMILNYNVIIYKKHTHTIL